MGTHITWGNDPLEPSGLVTLMRCGHWWVYPVHADPEQMHELAQFNLGLACSFCLAEWQAATSTQASGTAMRVN